MIFTLFEQAVLKVPRRDRSRDTFLYLESVYFYTGGAIDLAAICEAARDASRESWYLCATSTPDLSVLEVMDGCFYDVHDKRYLYLRTFTVDFVDCHSPFYIVQERTYVAPHLVEILTYQWRHGKYVIFLSYLHYFLSVIFLTVIFHCSHFFLFYFYLAKVHDDFLALWLLYAELRTTALLKDINIL